MSLRGRISVVLVLLLVVSIVLNAVWIERAQRSQLEREMVEKARVLEAELDAVWEFIDINQNRIDTDSDGSYNFKGIYCAIAGQSIAKILERDTDYVVRYASEEPRKKNSLVDEFEATAIASFETGETSYYAFTEYDGQKVFRYVSPIYIEKSCLSCHGGPKGEIDVTGYPKEGKEIGDLAGVKSIVMPLDLAYEGVREAVSSQVIYSSVVIVAVVLVIFLFITRAVARPVSRIEHEVSKVERGQFDVTLSDVRGGREIEGLAEKVASMAAQLKELYAGLESQVEDRTSQLKQANEMLERQRNQLSELNERLKEESKVKSDYLAVMSHELRTPLSSILAFTEIWERSHKDDDDKDRTAILEVKENAQLLLQMVSNILEMSRAEEGRMKLTLEPLDMIDLVAIVERSLGFLAARKNIALKVSVDRDVPIVNADWEKVRRIIENLLSNAIKYTRKGGNATLRVEYEPAEDMLVIKVSDTGIGISEEGLRHLFERFAQHDESARRRYKGSGLGLAVVRELAELHGGTVSAESIYHEGSTFTVRIPARTEIQKEPGDGQDSASR